MSKDWLDIIELFNKHAVKYLVVGAIAMARYGYVRGTGDFDIWVEATRENAKKVSSALVEFGAPINDESIFECEQNILQIGVPPNRIDITTVIDGVSFSDAWSRREVMDLDGTQICVIRLDDLILNKRASGREKDMIDLKTLQKIKEKKQ